MSKNEKKTKRDDITMYEFWNIRMNIFAWCVKKHCPEQANELINMHSTYLKPLADLDGEQIVAVYCGERDSHLIGQEHILAHEKLLEFEKEYLCNDVPKELVKKLDEEFYRMKGGIVPSGDE